MDVQSVFTLPVLAPLLTAAFGVLVTWGGIRDLLRHRRFRAGARRVPGLVVEMVEVSVPGDLRPFAAPVIEYADGVQTKRFQAAMVARLGHGKRACSAGDRVTVLLPPDGSGPHLDQPASKLLTHIATMGFGVAIVCIAFIVRFILTQPTVR